MRKLAIILLIVAAAAGGSLWALAAPESLPETAFQGVGDPDLANGKQVFIAGGCASCHSRASAQDGSETPEPDAADEPVLAGGHALETEFGTFHVPNISPSQQGIGNWTFEQFADAMLRGTAPDGSHYYPAFPYGSYAMMDIVDVNDLWGYIGTLPESDNEAPPHDLAFPFNINRAVGLWKYLYMPDGPRVALDDADPSLRRGQYLVEVLGHCGECHTPRDALGGPIVEQWLAGADNPSGDGRIPNITPGGGISDWSREDIVYYLESGFTPDFDTVGGDMVDVQRAIARLPAEDRDAMASYLKAIPAHE